MIEVPTFLMTMLRDGLEVGGLAEHADVDRLLAVRHLTARRRDVLVLERRGDVGDDGVRRDQLVGVDPDAHRAIEVAHHLDLADARRSW